MKKIFLLFLIPFITIACEDISIVNSDFYLNCSSDIETITFIDSCAFNTNLEIEWKNGSHFMNVILPPETKTKVVGLKRTADANSFLSANDQFIKFDLCNQDATIDLDLNPQQFLSGLKQARFLSKHELIYEYAGTLFNYNISNQSLNIYNDEFIEINCFDIDRSSGDLFVNGVLKAGGNQYLHYKSIEEDPDTLTIGTSNNFVDFRYLDNALIGIYSFQNNAEPWTNFSRYNLLTKELQEIGSFLSLSNDYEGPNFNFGYEIFNNQTILFNQTGSLNQLDLTSGSNQVIWDYKDNNEDPSCYSNLKVVNLQYQNYMDDFVLIEFEKFDLEENGEIIKSTSGLGLLDMESGIFDELTLNL